MPKTRSHMIVAGRVQGVLFRQSAKAAADGLGVTGWVHNLLDGRVEIVCEGEERNVQEFVEWARHGPPLAYVEHVEIKEEEYQGAWNTFEIHEFGF